MNLRVEGVALLTEKRGMECLGFRTEIWKLRGLMGWVEAGRYALYRLRKNAIRVLFLKC
jgi:hypothetical protein